MPEEQIAVRIRRARLRRAAGAGLLAVAAVAGAASGVILTHEPAPGHAASYSAPPLPASFTASDGAAYRRLAVTSLTEPAQRPAVLTVTAGSEPVDLMGACDAPASGAFIGVKVNGVAAGIIVCEKTPQLIGLSVRPGREARITFVGSSILGFPDAHANWRLAAYAWTPPATARPAPPVPRLPLTYTGPNTTAGHGNALRRVVASRSGDWPADRTATFTLTYRGRSLDISMVCAGAIASRLQVSFQVDGSGPTPVPCTSTAPGSPQAGSAVSGRPGKPITLTFRIQAPGPGTAAADYAKRAASWTIAVYEEQT